MKHLLRYLGLFVSCAFWTAEATAQALIFKDLHQVQNNETLYSIARAHGVTVQDLINVNPEVNKPGYTLRIGTMIKIPFAKGQEPKNSFGSQATTVTTPGTTATVAPTPEVDMRRRTLRVGVMLPLHDINGDGKRMLEYYRGVLMACDSLRSNGISTDVCSWNVAEDTDIRQILRDPNAANRDLIIGPLYTSQLKTLGDFAKAHDIRVVIPFSVKSNEVFDNAQLFQVYQNGLVLNEAYIYRFMQRFKGYHPVIIDCNDSTSTKGPFTFSLRQKLEQEGIVYSIGNLRSSEKLFQQCFSTTQPNVVILNSSRSTELSVVFAKLNGMKMMYPNVEISMFGYPEWLQYTRSHLDNFYKFDVYVPSTYYMNPLSPRTERFRLKYRSNFHQELQPYPQRFAMTGFDHAYYFIKGLHLYGKKFTGGAGMVGYTPYQTPLQFERIGNGGMQNRAMLFVHYMREQRIETIHF